MSDGGDPTPVEGRLATVEHQGGRVIAEVRRFQLVGLEGSLRGETWESGGDRCAIGSHELNDFVVVDPTVSRFHCEIVIDAAGARVVDLDSRNGTVLDGVVVKEAWLRPGSLLRLGRTLLRFELGTASNRIALSQRTELGGLVGSSAAMRATFAMLERAATSDATVLLEGETGTGKGLAAAALHQGSSRARGPFHVVDCGAVPATLLESELFGHERGAFTGADARRAGAFEEADGGTLFLDEIGELPVALQPKLLRALESRRVRRLGSNADRAVDVRVVAATNRDLRGEVNAGRFRPDLYFRLAVVKIPLPPLRQRPEDIPILVERLLASLAPPEELAAPLRSPDFARALAAAAWPGNVRELRNCLERSLVLQQSLPVEDLPLFSAGASPEEDAFDLSVPFPDARRRAIEAFERGYVGALMRAHEGRIAEAAAAGGINRSHLYRLLYRLGLKP